MEKIFKSKGMTTVEKWGTLCILITICGIYLFVKEVSALCGFFVAIPYIFSSYKRKYIVKENGDLWAKTMFGVVQKATGVTSIHYNPSTKGWQWRTRQMVVRYQNGLKKGFFPITPADPEGLIAALKEKNPGLELQYTYK
ncbi:hypothetical protein [Bacteroides oleiciplenus]|uniref:Uncharacterized protein n=2 Tax=Bacteroides oleiciplenus TaxID=626931 RepID=K9E5G8_9BACE|nr:hypothetical protein [Bacteroides oleiciplenus]EKU91061.1 hypothetical protein HMPREF9447_02479 [Bacteroides oleiciplenus YIT 12058]RGN32332.1 hypothetical protein DXB65_18770 [Bacteroides oleiciplenus]